MTELDAARHHDAALDTAQSARGEGNLKEFRRLVEIVTRYRQLCLHLRRGGSIH